MKMIVGGAYQGKLEYARKLTGYKTEEFADGSCCDLEEIFKVRGITNFHLYVKRCLETGESWERLAKTVAEKNPELVIVTNELGYGVVPCDPADRRWREAVGRVCTALARESSQVIRVVCGIGMVLKDETDGGC